MKSINLFLLICTVFLLLSCTGYKKIKLKSYNNNSYFILQNNLVDIYLNKNDILDLTSNYINSLKNDKRIQFENMYNETKGIRVNNIYTPIDFKQDKNLNDTLLSVYTLISFFHYELLKSGKAKIYNKQSKNYEDYIYYHRKNDRFGNGGLEFTFKDKTPFYYYGTSLGE